MATLIIKWLIDALAILLISKILVGIHVPSFTIALTAALALGLLNVTLRPILKILTFPITILTLGLFAFIVNGFTFWLVGKFVTGFTVDGFWWAVLGALLVSVVSTVVNRIVMGEDGKLGGT